MPSCHACRKWFSEEDGGCGCPNETIHMTREMLTKALAEARRKALLEVYERVKNLRGCNAYDVIDSIEEMSKETTNG